MVGGTEVVTTIGATAVVVVVQLSSVFREDDVVKSTVRSGLRIVSVTVPLAGAVPFSLQICCGPELPLVS